MRLRFLAAALFMFFAAGANACTTFCLLADGGPERLVRSALAKTPQFALPAQAVSQVAAKVETRRCMVSG